MGKFLKLIWLGARVSAAGGAVYALNEQQVWSRSTDTDRIFRQLREAVPAECKEITSTYITPYLPSSSYFHLNLSQHWNNGVLFSFRLLSELPETCNAAVSYTAALASQALASVNDAATPEEQQPAVITPVLLVQKQDECDCPQ